MSATKSILPETARFAANTIHHEEISILSPENLPNFNNPLHSNIEEQNDTYTFKKFTSQPYSLDFVEAASKEIGAHKINKH